MKTQLFEILNLKNDGILNFAINQENVLKIFLKNLLRLIVYLKKQGDLLNQLGLGHGFRKVHEDIIDNCPSF